LLKRRTKGHSTNWVDITIEELAAKTELPMAKGEMVDNMTPLQGMGIVRLANSAANYAYPLLDKLIFDNLRQR
jgi:hypothetical protein